MAYSPKPKSESALVWSFLKFVLFFPIILMQILFKKRSAKEFLAPFREFMRFIFEPKVTMILIFLNVFAFLLEILYFSKVELQQFIFRPEHLFKLDFTPIVASWFLHASWTHLMGNMLFLFIFGRVVERNVGSMWTMVIYFISAVASTVVSAFFNLGGIGASGAIAGLISTAILLEPFYLTYLIIGIPLPVVVVAFLAMLSDITNLLIPVQFDNVNHIAHLAGYLFVIPILLLIGKQKQVMKRNLTINIVLLVLFIFLKAFFLS